MTKEQYMEIRNAEKELDECEANIKKLENFFETYKDFIEDFYNSYTIEAIKKIKRYKELLSYKSKLLNNKLENIRNKYERICKHEIVLCLNRYVGLKDEDLAYKCQLCGNRLHYKELTKETIIIDSEFLYYDEYIQKAIDYIIDNNLEFSEETMASVRSIIFPNNKYTLEKLKKEKLIWRKK